MAVSVDYLDGYTARSAVGMRSVGSVLGTKPAWQEISQRFPDERDCLASFILLEVAEVLEGAKPANLLGIANRPRPCGRNLYQLWKKHGASLLAGSGLMVRELVDRQSSLLLLFYRAEVLEELLARKDVAAVLKKAGYTAPGNRELVLAELQQRFSEDAFPHEIGVFLGYPLKDVVGFLGWAPLPFSCQGPWKIFGDPTPSLKMAENHRLCRCRMSQLLSSEINPQQCLKGIGSCRAAV